MSDELPSNLGPVIDFFGLPNTATATKDFYVARAIRAVAGVDAAPFALIFAGGTALARAHRLVRRMSEDVDFKVTLPAATPLSRNQLRQKLGTLRDRVTAALESAGFTVPASVRSRDENRYTLWQLPYDAGGGAGEGLRPTIQIELTHARLRLPPVFLPVSSFVAEAFKHPPEVPSIACVSLAETAAEKLVSITRRTAMELAGLSRAPDPTLVRHIYDLHALGSCVDAAMVSTLAWDIARTDAVEFRNQYPAFAADIGGETRKALDVLRSDATRRRYDEFISAMVYGERLDFAAAVATVVSLAETMMSSGQLSTE